MNLYKIFAKTIKEQVSGSAGTTTVQSIVGSVLEAIFLVAGIIAVVVIIIGGVLYMTAQGDPGKITKGKNCVIGGVIGLVICLLAFAIVTFAINGFLGIV